MRLATILSAPRKAAASGVFALSLLAATLGGASHANAADPLRIGYSDWPGWVAWQVAIDKGWLKEAGVDATSNGSTTRPRWMPSRPASSMPSPCTNGDALVMGGNGAKSVMIMLTDYSNGNDMIVGKPGVKTLAELKGKKVGIEVGLVEHLLLDQRPRKDRHEGERRDARQRQDQRDAAGPGLGRRRRRSAPGSRSPARR